MLDWNDLKYVLETARHGGLSGAARALGVNHATVSRRISTIEQQIGTQLFDRLPTGYTPTKAGEQAVKTAEQMEDAQAQLSRAIGAQDKKLSGPLSITAPQLLFSNILTPILDEFTQQHPDIDITVLANNAPLNLTQREADVAIRVADDPPETLYGSCVAKQRSAIYVHRDYAKSLRDRQRTLAWLKFLHWHDIPKDVKALWPDTYVALTFNDMVAVQSAVRAGLGASRMPCFLGDLDPDLVRLEGLPTYSYPSIWVLTHPEIRTMTRVQLFLQFAATRLRKMRAIFDGSSALQH